jgi:hypothetical protein
VALLLSAAEARSQGPDTVLARLEWLVGGSWTAATSGGRALVPPALRRASAIQVDYRWGPGRRGLAYTVLARVAGRPELKAEGWVFTHPETGELVLRELDADGNVTRGTASLGPDGFTLTERLLSPGGAGWDLRAEVTRQGPDAFLFQGSYAVNGGWQLALVLEYRRGVPGPDQR